MTRANNTHTALSTYASILKIIAHWKLTLTLWCRYYHFHFTCKQIQAQRG